MNKRFCFIFCFSINDVLVNLCLVFKPDKATNLLEKIFLMFFFLFVSMEKFRKYFELDFSMVIVVVDDWFFSNENL